MLKKDLWLTLNAKDHKKETCPTFVLFINNVHDSWRISHKFLLFATNYFEDKLLKINCLNELSYDTGTLQNLVKTYLQHAIIM